MTMEKLSLKEKIFYRRHFIQSLLLFLGAGASIKSKRLFASMPNKNLIIGGYDEF